MPNFYLVGGAIRDELLGIKSSDNDFAVEANSYSEMRQAIIGKGGQIFLEKPEFFTIRAKVPNLGAADYVLCRKDGSYFDGRRPESVTVGTIYDDLARRDFSSGAIAQNVETGEIIDPFNGVADVKVGVLRCVGNPLDRFHEDGLRILRAFRFKITKGFHFDGGINKFLLNEDVPSYLKGVSEERIRGELYKMFSFNTLHTLNVFYDYPILMEFLFSGRIWLKPTMEER
jgi:tRNA nucleotidyltransferase/poly(A) polymerase